MQWMLNLQTYKLKIYYNITAEEFIDWVEEQISWKSSVQFTMKQLCKMIEKLIQESREVLFYNLMLIKFKVEIPIREDGFISTGNATDSASVGVQANWKPSNLGGNEQVGMKLGFLE